MCVVKMLENLKMIGSRDPVFESWTSSQPNPKYMSKTYLGLEK